MPDAPVLDSQSQSGQSSLDPNAAPSQQTSLETPSWTKDWVKDGSFDHTAFDKAPDDFKAYRKELETFKTPDQLAKSYHELRAMASSKGSSLLEPLPKDASNELRAERMNAIRKAIGAPDKPEGYVIEKPKDLPDNLWDMKAVGEVAKIAFEEGISQQAIQKLSSWEAARTQAGMAAQQKQVTDMWAEQDQLARTALAKEGLDYNKGRDLAERAGKRFFGVDKDNPIFQNATVLAGLARVGHAMGEHQLVQGDTSEDALRNMTPASAEAAAKNISDNRSNPEWFAYWNRDPENPKKEKIHPEHDEVVAKHHKFSAIANANRRR